MKARARFAPLRLGALVIGVAAAVSCASSGGSSAGTDGAFEAPESEQKTQQELQSELMAFADRFFAQTLSFARTLEATLDTPESRYNAAGSRLLGLTVTADIAASPNPGAAVLDMCVYVTLKRMAWEEHWMPEVYGEEEGRAVLDGYRELEDDIWGIAASVYTPDQIATLKGLIHDWRSRHPDTVAVDFVRLAELGDARKVQNLIDAGRPGGMLAPVKEANRNIEEMRMLAERLVFMATRMQMMVSLQVEMASAKLAAQPEVRQLLEDSRSFTEATDLAAEAFAALVADLPEERRAAIDQVLAGLSQERESLLADIGAEDGEIRPALGDFRDTFEAGRRLAEMINEAVINSDRMVKRILEDESARPFDIMDYQATIAEATVTVREFQTVVTSIERILGSPVTEGQLDTIVEGASRLEDEVIDDIIDRAFLRGVALIVIFFIVLTIYRLLLRRLAPDLVPKRTSKE
jgi:hypothetical protein